MYKWYWPNAIAVDDKGRVTRLFTYDCCFSLKEAKQVIENWNTEGPYKGCLVASYIQHSWDKKKVCCKFYERRLRSLEWG